MPAKASSSYVQAADISIDSSRVTPIPPVFDLSRHSYYIPSHVLPSSDPSKVKFQGFRVWGSPYLRKFLEEHGSGPIPLPSSFGPQLAPSAPADMDTMLDLDAFDIPVDIPVEQTSVSTSDVLMQDAFLIPSSPVAQLDINAFSAPLPTLSLPLEADAFTIPSPSPSPPLDADAFSIPVTSPIFTFPSNPIPNAFPSYTFPPPLPPLVNPTPSLSPSPPLGMDAFTIPMLSPAPLPADDFTIPPLSLAADAFAIPSLSPSPALGMDAFTLPTLSPSPLPADAFTIPPPSLAADAFAIPSLSPSPPLEPDAFTIPDPSPSPLPAHAFAIPPRSASLPLEADAFLIPLYAPSPSLPSPFAILPSSSPPLEVDAFTIPRPSPSPLLEADAFTIPAQLPPPLPVDVPSLAADAFAIPPLSPSPPLEADVFHIPELSPSPLPADAFTIPPPSLFSDAFAIPPPSPTPPLEMDAFSIPVYVPPPPSVSLNLDLDSFDFRFTEISDSSEAEVDISGAYIEVPQDRLTTPPSYPDLPSSPEFHFSSVSSLRDSDDDEILSQRMVSPPAESHNVHVDEVTDMGYQAVHDVPRTVRLMLPSHIHPAFPGCTPSTPATSQQMPQELSRYSEAVEHSYREVMKTAKSNIAVNHALHRQLADLDLGMRRMGELMEQKCRTMMYSLPRTS